MEIERLGDLVEKQPCIASTKANLSENIEISRFLPFVLFRGPAYAQRRGTRHMSINVE